MAAASTPPSMPGFRRVARSSVSSRSPARRPTPKRTSSARMFFDAFGWREDPATGSANVAFAALLRAAGTEGRVVVDQGTQMGRPSRLYLEIGEAIRLGGKVQPVMTGTFRLPS